MSKRTKIFLIGFLLFWAGITAYLFAQVEGEGGIPCELYGSVMYKGASAYDGLKVEATIDDKSFAETTTKNGQYRLSIPSDNSSTSIKDGWVAGDVIYLKVNGFPASPNFKATAISFNLNLSVASSDVKLTTWGKIKALFK